MSDTRQSYIMAFDPGDTTGWAAFASDGDLMGMGQVLQDDMATFLAGYSHLAITHVIIEDFILFKKRAIQQSGSRMKASQVIGMLKLWAAQQGAEVVMQKADIKSIAMKWSQITMPGQHSQSHQFDAYLHGYYWLVGHKIIKTQLALEQEHRNG